ncbi:hypothetical protein ACL6C3_12405 [Capilliphycus salinus ALCB114379]|uniref:hypothetical protein n=1 Tax=Capilliphycus salinus TaxID=2768948 RepID=UPI0039A75CB3
MRSPTYSTIGALCNAFTPNGYGDREFPIPKITQKTVIFCKLQPGTRRRVR